jgi:LacI family transcriptional regulator
VDGVIVAGKVDTAFIEELVSVGLPFILVDFSHADYPCLSIDNRGGVIEAISFLIEKRGHRSIAFLGADMTHPSIRERLQGYRIALFQAGISLNEEHVLTSDSASPTHETGFRLAVDFFRLQNRPTAVFCVNDAMALGFMRYAHEQGFRIPEDVALIGFDDVDGAVFASPPLTTVRVFKEQFGEMAMRQLIEKVEGSSRSDGSYRYDRTTERLILSTELVVRGSA